MSLLDNMSIKEQLDQLHQRVARLEGARMSYKDAPQDPFTPVLINESHWNDGDMDLRAKARSEVIDRPRFGRLCFREASEVAFDAGWDAAIDFVLTNYKVLL